MQRFFGPSKVFCLPDIGTKDPVKRLTPILGNDLLVDAPTSNGDKLASRTGFWGFITVDRHAAMASTDQTGRGKRVRHDIASIHIIGSRKLGGAEKFFIRLVNALAEIAPTTAVIRPGSPIGGFLTESVRVYTVSMRWHWDRWSAYRLRRLIVRLGYPIVQTYMGRATRLTRIPSGDPTIHIARLGGYYKIDGYYTHADFWVGNTEGICRYLKENGLPAERILHIGNFVDPPPPFPSRMLRSIRKSINIPDSSPVFFALGRFVSKKGFDHLLKAFSTFVRMNPQTPSVLIIAGDGPEAPKLQRLADSLGLQERLRWLGWTNDPDPFFHLAHIFICPSYHEPLGNVILEAWNHGKPVISTATAGARELIRDGENGILVPCAAPAEMALAMDRLIGDPFLAQKLAIQGYETVEQHFRRETVLSEYMKLYEKALRMKRTLPRN